jgi:hypothetical protein
MSLSDYVRYENIFKRSFYPCQQKTTKEEWTERLEFVYKCSKDYILLSKPVNDTYVNYRLYKNKELYTDDKETTSTIRLTLYDIYYNEYKKQCNLKIPIVKAFKERFPNINNAASELDHYLYCCELYASHKLKGIEYNLPFPVDSDVPASEDHKVEPSTPENVIQKPEGKWEDLKVVRTKSKPLIIKEKKKYPKKHTLSILLTQEKEKTKKLQQMLGHVD